ncbi:MAG TPA: Crp/Fnr family transcriptional regulator [Candidatus Acidoferrum sp.]|nr:Crp/Fnr family transcriptional regulator [Candidatus Acidoferrum sp.]
MPSQDLSTIAAITIVKSLDKGQYLFRQSDNPHGFFVVQNGAINVHRVNSSGREQVLRVFRAGESLAEETVAAGSGYPADARAVEDSQVLQVQKSGFLALIKCHPDLALKILSAVGRNFRALISHFDDVTLRDVEGRLANWLLQRCPDPASTEPITVELQATKRLLASELGTVSETLSRTFTKFRQRQLIQQVRKSIIVLSPMRLAELVQAEN